VSNNRVVATILAAWVKLETPTSTRIFCVFFWIKYLWLHA
jgi:hypothetical protein